MPPASATSSEARLTLNPSSSAWTAASFPRDLPPAPHPTESSGKAGHRSLVHAGGANAACYTKGVPPRSNSAVLSRLVSTTASARRLSQTKPAGRSGILETSNLVRSSQVWLSPQVLSVSQGFYGARRGRGGWKTGRHVDDDGSRVWSEARLASAHFSPLLEDREADVIREDSHAR
jgi:hypothetical protein